MTSIFTKVKPGDLITSDLFNQITDKIEEMHEITAVMEIKKNSEADASELGNLSVKGNVGIGTKDSPSEKLEVNGTVKTGNDGQLLLLKGLKSSKKGEESSMNLDFMTSSQGRTLPSIPTASFRAIDDEYFSSHLGFFTKETSPDQNNLTERLRITSNGKVGIGTTEPSEKLEVSGTVKADKFKGDGSGLTGIKTGQWTDVTGGVSYNSGNVGIGTSTPGSPLDVIRTGGAAIRALSNSENSPTGYQLGRTSAESTWGVAAYAGDWAYDAKSGDVIFRTEKPDQRFLFKTTSIEPSELVISSGKVGIGMSPQEEKLEVNGTVKADMFLGYLSIRTLNIDARVLSHEMGFWGAPGGMVVGTNSAHSLSFGTSATSRMTINEDGNVGIGTINPTATLEVNGTVKADKFLGDGSGLTGIKTGQWTDVTGGVSYNSGNVGIGTINPTATLEVNGNIKVSIIDQDDWTDVKPEEFLNGWRNLWGNNYPGYFLDKNGIVHLKGMVEGGYILYECSDENHSVIFKLPQNCCPANREVHIVASNDPNAYKGYAGLGRCDITPEGNVVAVAGGHEWFSLDGITFRAKFTIKNEGLL